MGVIANSTLYLSVAGIQSFLNFLLLPLYTNYLTPYDFGIVNVVNSVAALLGLIYIMGMTGSVSRLYFEYRDDPDKLKNFISTIFLGKIIVNFLITAILLIFNRHLFPILAEGIPFYPFLLISIGIGFFSTIFILFQTLQQTRQNGLSYSIYQIAYLLLNNGLSVLFLLVFNLGGLGIVLGTLLSHFIMDIFALINLRKYLRFNIDIKVFRGIIAYSIPLGLHAIFTWGLGAVNKLFVNNMISTEEVGIYSIGFFIAGLVSMVAVAFNHSFTPWFFEKMKKTKNNYDEIVRFSEFIVLIYSFFAFLLSIFSREIINLFLAKEFRDSWIIVPILAFSYVFNGLYFFFVNIFNYKIKYVKYIPVISFLAAMINIFLNIVLIPYLGIIGSSIATFVAMILLSFIAYKGSKKFTAINYNYSRMIYIILIPLIFSLLVYIFPEISIEISILLKIFYAFLIFGILFLLHRGRYQENMNNQLLKISKFLSGIKGGSKNIK